MANSLVVMCVGGGGLLGEEKTRGHDCDIRPIDLTRRTVIGVISGQSLIKDDVTPQVWAPHM